MALFASLTGERSAKTTKTSESTDEKSKYRGVEVQSNGDGCCDAARAIAGKRFLSDDVPMLPLDDCDASNCQCRYKLFEDRRTDVRRGADLAYDLASELCEHDNRNKGSKGRRHDD